MAHLRLSVASIDITTAWALSREDGRPYRHDTLRLGVHPEQRDYLRLKTGEIFCHPSNADFPSADPSRIAASLVIEQAGFDHDGADNKLRYLSETARDGNSHRSAIEFRWCLPTADFQELLINIRSGLVPDQGRHRASTGDRRGRHVASIQSGGRWKRDQMGQRQRRGQEARAEHRAGQPAVSPARRLGLTAPRRSVSAPR